MRMQVKGHTTPPLSAGFKDEVLADNNNLPPPEVIAREIVGDLEAAL